MRAEVEPTYPPFVPQPWAVDALCAQTDPALFFPSPGESTKAAKATCAVCPVRAQCLDYAVTTRQGWGVWGGVRMHSRGKRLRAVA